MLRHFSNGKLSVGYVFLISSSILSLKLLITLSFFFLAFRLLLLKLGKDTHSQQGVERWEPQTWDSHRWNLTVHFPGMSCVKARGQKWGLLPASRSLAPGRRLVLPSLNICWMNEQTNERRERGGESKQGTCKDVNRGNKEIDCLLSVFPTRSGTPWGQELGLSVTTESPALGWILCRHEWM